MFSSAFQNKNKNEVLNGEILQDKMHLKNHCAESAYYNVLPFKQGVNAKKENE